MLDTWYKLLCLVIFLNLAVAQDNLEIPDEFSLEEDFDIEADEELLREIENKQMVADLERENDIASRIAAASINTLNEQKVPVQIDPCSKIHCGAGRICKAENNDASCVCISQCSEELDPRRKVCTNNNETWNSDCEVHRERCVCETNNSLCLNQEHKHIHIDYYGECKTMPVCTEEEKSDFPRRMRDWLFNIMRDLAERDELPKTFLPMQMESETNLSNRWAKAAVWKWCDLDGYPHDRSVSRHELFPIRAPLMSLEHCIAPFLESCDPNGDHRITLKEWGNCLELKEVDVLDQCDEMASEKLKQN